MYLVWDNFGHWVEEPATDKDLANSVIIWLKVLECIIFNLNVFKTAVYIVMKSKKLNSEHVKNICDLTLSNKNSQIRLLIISNLIITLLDRNMAAVKVKGWIEKVEETFDSQSDGAPLSSKETKNILSYSGVNYCLFLST